MARFYGEVSGQAGTSASRLGSERSGISGHIRGWSLGVRVEGRASMEDGGDEFSVYVTSGSNGGSADVLIAVVHAEGFSVKTGPGAGDWRAVEREGARR